MPRPRSGHACAVLSSKTSYAYDAADQLLTQSGEGTPTVSNTWSANGALASSTTGAGTATYVSDLTDELVSVVLEDDTEVAYSHDAAGHRTSRSLDGVTDVSWAWDDVLGLPMRVGEYDDTDSLSVAWLPDVMSATGAPLVETNGGVTSWMMSDPFANITGAVTTGGTVLTGTRALGGFGGERAPATGSLATSQFGFSGQYLDAVTGLYDMRARDYDTTTGRFTATDPVQVPTGMPYFASYVYGHNNPLMFTDPTGEWSWEQWQAFVTFDSTTADAAWEGLENLGTWSAGFGDTLTFGGTAQIRELISYETGGGRIDMVDHDSVFYPYGRYGGMAASVGPTTGGGRVRDEVGWIPAAQYRVDEDHCPKCLQYPSAEHHNRLAVRPRVLMGTEVPSIVG